MFAYEFSAELEQELSEIPAEYQEAFRHAIEQELLEGEHDHTDSNRLRYLRQRRSAFRQGSYIRPDGRPGTVQLSPEALYEQGFADQIHAPADSGTDPSERRRTLLKVAGLLCLVLLFLFSTVRARARRTEARAATPTATAIVVVAAQPTPQPTPLLPDVTGADETLKTVGGLGGTLTLGRPSSLTLHYRSTEETIALPIDPSRPTNKGEVRYDEARMLSDNPVAVWLFGTVLNYAIGIPDALVRNLQTGDELTVNTDTGAALHFIVSEQWEGANHETSRWLSQNRTGLTLFALPAVAETQVAFAFARYDLMREIATATPQHSVGDTVSLAQTGSFQIASRHYDQTETGEQQVTLMGKATVAAAAAQPLWLALSADWGQSDATALNLATDGSWTASYMLPAAAIGTPLFAELRQLPTDVVAIALGEVPALANQLELSLNRADWQPETQTVMLALTVYNPTPSNIYLSPDLFSLAYLQGGDPPRLSWQATTSLQSQTQLRPQPLPMLILPGETRMLSAAFLPTQSSIQLHVGHDHWEISDMPIVSK